MRADTKARSIPMAVKQAVADRDSIEGWPCCLWCGRPAPSEAPWSYSCAHYIGRAQGGLGIESNVLTLCPVCHRLYDQTTNRKKMRAFFLEYLKEKYPGWDESKLVYRKEST